MVHASYNNCFDCHCMENVYYIPKCRLHIFGNVSHCQFLLPHKLDLKSYQVNLGIFFKSKSIIYQMVVQASMWEITQYFPSRGLLLKLWFDTLKSSLLTYRGLINPLFHIKLNVNGSGCIIVLWGKSDQLSLEIYLEEQYMIFLSNYCSPNDGQCSL